MRRASELSSFSVDLLVGKDDHQLTKTSLVKFIIKRQIFLFIDEYAIETVSRRNASTFSVTHSVNSDRAKRNLAPLKAGQRHQRFPCFL